MKKVIVILIIISILVIGYFGYNQIFNKTNDDCNTSDLCDVPMTKEEIAIKKYEEYLKKDQSIKKFKINSSKLECNKPLVILADINITLKDENDLNKWQVYQGKIDNLTIKNNKVYIYFKQKDGIYEIDNVDFKNKTSK